MRTITFYSYKGGVGRSLALANIATRLSEFGRQVCMLDFDLEAPGLHYKFAVPLSNNAQKIDKGIVDYIHEFTCYGIVSDSLREFSYSWFPYPQSCMTIIPAGNPDYKDYWKKLSTINWYNLLYESESGLGLLLDLKEKIRREINPDFLLVDSRTGISEMSGIALSLLADEVVVLAANNRENLEGAKKIIRSISNPDKMILGKAPKVTFVLCRIPFTTSPDDRVKEQNLRTKIKRDFGSLINDLTIIHSDRDLEENEQIKIGYDKDESVAQISRDYLELFERLTVEDLRPAEIESFKNIKDSEKYFQKAATEIDAEEKLKLINKAIELNKTNTEFHLSRAAIFEKRSDWEKVIDACDEILRFETINLRPYEMKGNAFLKLNKIEQAKEMFQIVLNRDSNRDTARLGLAQIAILEKNLQEALNILNQILDHDPQNAIAYIERADLKRRIGQSYSALEDVYQALDLQIDNAAAFLALAKINADLENKNEFFLNFEKAIQLKDKPDKTIETEIQSDNVYKRFLKDQRFLKILERYNIQLTKEIEDSIDDNLNNSI
jgi:MinD-like ATPase involved in chromosome partitioning or flagellar assembly